MRKKDRQPKTASGCSKNCACNRTFLVFMPTVQLQPLWLLLISSIYSPDSRDNVSKNRAIVTHTTVGDNRRYHVLLFFLFFNFFFSGIYGCETAACASFPHHTKRLFGNLC